MTWNLHDGLYGKILWEIMAISDDVLLLQVRILMANTTLNNYEHYYKVVLKWTLLKCST